MEERVDMLRTMVQALIEQENGNQKEVCELQLAALRSDLEDKS